MMTESTVRLPLLHDAHTHPLLYAAFREGVDLSENPEETRGAAIDRIRTRADEVESGWTIGYAWNSGRYRLTSTDFDGLPPVVIFNLSLHGVIVNDSGRALLQQEAPDVVANLEDQDWIERNLQQVLNRFASAGASVDRLQRFYDWLLAERGVYHAEEMLLVGAEEVRLFDEAGLIGRTRFWAAPEMYDQLPGSIRKKVHGIKLFADGALGASSASLYDRYKSTQQHGILMYETSQLHRLLERYIDADITVAVHAIGNRAIDQVVSAAASVGRPVDGLIRIEHVQFPSTSTARKAKQLGIRFCMQPNFSNDSIHYADRLPEGYSQRNNPFRMLIDDVGYVPGEDLVFGSDGMPHGVHDALRQALFPPFPEQALTLDEFIRGYGCDGDGPGFIEADIDPGRRTVDCRIILDRDDS